MVREEKVEFFKGPLQQRKNGRIVFVLAPAEKQRLKPYIDKGSMTKALQETVSIIYEIGLESKGVKVIPRLDDMESFIWDIGKVLRNKGINTTIKSKKLVIQIKAGHIFLSRSAACDEEANQACKNPALAGSIQAN